MAGGKRLYPVLKKIIFCSRVFGTYPYNELIHTDNHHSIWIFYQAFLIISNGVHAFCIEIIPYDIESRQFLFGIFVSFTRFVISALPTVNFVNVLMKRHLMKEIFETLIEVDSRLEMVGFHPKYDLERRITYVTSSLTILCVVSFVLAVNIDLDSYLDVYHLAVALCTTFATIHLITDLVSIAGQQFRFINTFLSKSFSNQSRIDFFIVLHDKVSHTCCLLNKLFSKQMLVISFVVFFHTTITIHFLMDKNLSLYSLFTDKIIVMRICMTCVHLILGYVLINTCVWTGIQSKDFTGMLHMMVLAEETDRLCHNKKIGLHIAMDREIVFTACGFFNMDFTLIHSMVAAAATYLFLLMQLGKQIY